MIAWINNAVTQDITFQLSKFSTAKAVSDFLANLYVQDNYAKEYLLQGLIQAIRQGHSSIEDFLYQIKYVVRSISTCKAY